MFSGAYLTLFIRRFRRGPGCAFLESADHFVHVDALQANSRPIVFDRFFETKREADGWSNAHSEFMMLLVIPPGSA
jgi:hypothetical protein